jgi:hypothetical protein
MFLITDAQLSLDYDLFLGAVGLLKRLRRNEDGIYKQNFNFFLVVFLTFKEGIDFIVYLVFLFQQTEDWA